MSAAGQRKREAVPSAGAVLARAAFRAAGFLGISQADLAAIIGVSGATASRLANGGKALEEGSKPWQLAALFVRSFRSLDAIVGSDDTAARAWMRGANAALGGVPLELMREPAGLARTVDYLDAARARL
jgi:transcriptional regulator with XRE-family HTH domain